MTVVVVSMNEKLLQMAREAGFVSVRGIQGGPSALMCGTDELSRFAELVRADERAQIASLGEHTHFCRACQLGYTPPPMANEDCPRCGCDGTDESVESIRARGKQEKV